MNKKEVSEIKRQFTPDNCTITKICTCYVDHEKNIVCSSGDTFLLLPEEEQFKYLDIIKKTLSGSIGKNLMELHFPTEQEAQGGAQHDLLSLVHTHLSDESLVNAFFEKIVETYSYAENYFIVLIYAAYDVPGKSTSGDTMDDASDEVYDYILCSICPVKLSKQGLAYNEDKNMVCDRTRDWIVDRPMEGFLFPAFTDRSSDIHSVLAYQKKTDSDTGLFENILGCHEQLSPDQQNQVFTSVLNEALSNKGGYELMKTIHENLAQMEEEHRDESEPYLLDKKQITEVLEKSGVSQDCIQSMERKVLDSVGTNASFHVANLTDTKQFHIQVPNISIKVDPDFVNLVETKQIDGRTCLVIPVDEGEIKVNGANVHL